MRLPYKAAQLALYGNGDEIHLATSGGDNRLVVFDSKAVMTLSWKDQANENSKFSVALSRKELIECIRKRKPKSGYYLVYNVDDSRYYICDKNYSCTNKCTTRSQQNEECFIKVLNGKNVDISRFSPLYLGLSVNTSLVDGSVTINFDSLRFVFDFLNQYITPAKINQLETRLVNFQVVNEDFPLVIQTFVKCNDDIVSDLDIAFLSLKAK